MRRYYSPTDNRALAGDVAVTGGREMQRLVADVAAGTPKMRELKGNGRQRGEMWRWTSMSGL